MTARSTALLLLIAACHDRPKVTLHMWHTFGPDEAALLRDELDEAPVRVMAAVLPFGRMQNRLSHALATGEACPDLARIDATWLPQLAQSGWLTPVPDDTKLDEFLPEARELAEWRGTTYGLPQSVDGLALVSRGKKVVAPTLDELEMLARDEVGARRYGLSVRADGYWFLGYLRASGGDLEVGPTGAHLDFEAAEQALESYASLVEDGVAPRPSLIGNEAEVEARRFAAGEIAILIGGPWTVAALAPTVPAEELTVTPYPLAPDGRPAAPRGGQVYVVPHCAAHPAEAWTLAAQLTSVPVQVRWSRLGVVPTRSAALAEASPIARAFAETLSATRPLPRDPLTPELFDDLSPAVAAALIGDATPAEALAGVERSWRRLAQGPP